MARTSKHATINENFYNVALYIRVSNEDKDNAISESVQSQKALLESFVKSLSNVKSYLFYVDDGYSGGNFDRPSFKEMLENIATKKINCVIVKDLSRLGRNYIELSNYIQKIFPTLKTRFISINDNLDSENGMQEFDTLFIGLTGLMNEEYLKDCSIKSKMSYALRQNKGLFTSPVAPYGYLRDEYDIHKLVVDPKVSHVVKFIFEDYVEKQAFRAIAKDLSIKKIPTPSEYKQSKNSSYFTNKRTHLKFVWSPDTVATILKNQVYIGNMVQHKREVASFKTKQINKLDSSKWRITKNTHEPIISVELYNEVQNLISTKKGGFTKKTAFSNTNDNYFSGILYCGKCESKLTYVSDRNRKYTFYKCKISSLSKSLCNAKIIKTETIKNIVLNLLNSYIQIACDLGNCISNAQKQNISKNFNSKQSAKKQKTLQKQKDNLYQKYRNCEISISEYKAQKAELDNELLKIDAINNYEKPKINATLEELIKHKSIRTLTKEIVSAFISSIIVHSPNDIEINFKFKDEFNFAMEKWKRS